MDTNEREKRASEKSERNDGAVERMGLEGNEKWKEKKIVLPSVNVFICVFPYTQSAHRNMYHMCWPYADGGKRKKVNAQYDDKCQNENETIYSHTHTHIWRWWYKRIVFAENKCRFYIGIAFSHQTIKTNTPNDISYKMNIYAIMYLPILYR